MTFDFIVRDFDTARRTLTWGVMNTEDYRREVTWIIERNLAVLWRYPAF